MYYIRIVELREDNDFKQQYIADKLNISQRTYSHYERGERQIPLEILCNLANLYNVSVDYILERTDSKEPYPKPKKNKQIDD